MSNELKIYWYEVGHDETNILGSGSIREAYWKGYSEEEAIKKLSEPYMNYLIRHVKINGIFGTQWYNPYTKEWE